MTTTAQKSPLRKPASIPRNPPQHPLHVATVARISLREIEAVSDLCEWLIRALMDDGESPQPDFHMGARCVRWLSSLVTALLELASAASN